MTLWTSDGAVAATGGRSTTNWVANGVSIDTRSLEAGDLFVALKDIRDGHDFVAAALDAGAAAALVSRIPDGVPEDAPLLLVDDVLPALEAMGAYARARTDAKVIGVTGSVGKTSTKEMLRTAFLGQGKVHAAEKSFNNHWGVPLTLARMPQDTDFAILEIGMNHPGEIAPLAKLAKPHVTIITTVAPVHLEAFASVDGIATEKASINDGLVDGGIAIINCDVETASILRGDGSYKVESFGRSEDADWRLLQAETNAGATVCQAAFGETKILFKFGAPGQHFAMNGLACLAAVHAAGADIGLAAINLADWAPPAGRGKRRFVSLDAVDEHLGIDLFDDAYNANPASVAAALEVLATVSQDAPCRRIAFLGDMKELGPTQNQLHAAIAESPALAHIDKIHCVGPLMKALHSALNADKRGIWAETSAEVVKDVHTLLRAGDVVMVKGSLSMKMASIVDAIADLGQSQEKNK